MKRALRNWLLLSLLITTPLSYAGECENIANLSNWWAGVRNWVAAMDVMALSPEAQNQINTRFGEGLESTRPWADYFINQGGDLRTSIGEPLQQALNQIQNPEHWIGIFTGLFQTIRLMDAAAMNCAGSDRSPVPRAPGRIFVDYKAPPSDPSFTRFQKTLRETAIFEGLAEGISETIALPIDLHASFVTCQDPNAYYNPGDQRITMCYEFFSLFAIAFQDFELTDEELETAMLAVGAYFFLHEVGHALVHVLDLPITGREEDSVDALAGIILIHGELEEVLFATIENFDSLAQMSGEYDSNNTEQSYWDEHSLNAQRLYDVACLVYGSNPEANADMVGPDSLPEVRAARCPNEFEQKNKAWGTLLGPYFID